MTFTMTLAKMDHHLCLLSDFRQNVFGQFEPKRGCLDAALADTSRDFELALNVFESRWSFQASHVT